MGRGGGVFVLIRDVKAQETSEITSHNFAEDVRPHEKMTQTQAKKPKDYPEVNLALTPPILMMSLVLCFCVSKIKSAQVFVDCFHSP